MIVLGAFDWTGATGFVVGVGGLGLAFFQTFKVHKKVVAIDEAVNGAPEDTQTISEKVEDLHQRIPGAEPQSTKAGEPAVAAPSGLGDPDNGKAVDLAPAPAPSGSVDRLAIRPMLRQLDHRVLVLTDRVDDMAKALGAENGNGNGGTT